MDVFTLVGISIQRYLAICHPFIMMKLKSMSHSSSLSNLIVTLIWISGFLTALPNFYMYDLCLLSTTKRYKCERISLESVDDRVYIIGLDGKTHVAKDSACHAIVISVVCFVIPMTMMIALHGLIMANMSKRNVVAQNQFVPSKTIEIVLLWKELRELL